MISMKKLNNTAPRTSLTRQQLRRNRRARCFYFSAVLALTLCTGLTVPALAAGTDPLTIVNNLSNFIFSCIKAIGVIVLGWGIVQLGMSIQSHDASQRTQGILCVFGGLIIAFSKEILTTIGAV
ncbi:MAG: glutamyl-tRNA amidotransferase [Lawsonibacter sp.]|nr:glutamyl-tRNA amidotransferase [Lawsonibacter sp.]